MEVSSMITAAATAATTVRFDGYFSSYDIAFPLPSLSHSLSLSIYLSIDLSISASFFSVFFSFVVLIKFYVSAESRKLPHELLLRDTVIRANDSKSAQPSAVERKSAFSALVLRVCLPRCDKPTPVNVAVKTNVGPGRRIRA